MGQKLKWIRRTYGVPAYRGRRIRYTGGWRPFEGVIIDAAPVGRIRVRFGEAVHSLHPTWMIEYLPADVPPPRRRRAHHRR